MTTQYTVIFTAPNGSLSTTVVLKSDHQYQPDELIVQRDVPVRINEVGRMLTVTCEQLPNEPKFRELAARAATRAARSGDEGRKVVDALIPF